MVRAGMCVATGVLATVAAWVGGAHFVSVEAAPPADAKPVGDAKDAKGVDLTALRDAVESAGKRGENVDEVRKALDAFEKAAPKPDAGGVPPELQALRDAVDAAARKGENVEAVAKELVAVETLVAGKSLAKPKPPEPRPDPEPRPGGLPLFPNPLNPNLVPGGFPMVPFPLPLNPNLVPGGIDIELFNKAMGLRRKANELLMKNPRDPDALKERQKLLAEATELMMKAARDGGGIGGLPAPLFPDFGRVPDRARLGIRMDRVPAVAAEQLGLEPNTGIAVALVLADSPAEKAGLKIHDIILEFAGKPVTDNAEDFARRVSEIKAGAKVDLVVLRKGKKVEVKGVELPEANPLRVPPQRVPFPVPLQPGALPDPLVPLPLVPLQPN